jgi:DNA-binding response OmpR family regulator
MDEEAAMPKVCRVVVVEGHGAVRELLGNVFAHEGYRFSLAANGEEMRAELDKGDVDVVVIDIGVGNGSFSDLVDEATEAGAAVVLTSIDERARRDLEASGRRYLLKPYRLADMIAAVDDALRDAENTCARKKPRGGARVAAR